MHSATYSTPEANLRTADCIREANAITLEVGRGRRDYAPIEHDQAVDSFLRAFDGSLFERTAGTGSDTRRPVFVVGLARSGATLTERIRASHSRIHGASELRFTHRSFKSLPAIVTNRAATRYASHLDEVAVPRIAADHLGLLDAIDGGPAARIVDKMPDNYMYLGFLAVLFPRALFSHRRHNLRHIAVSCWMNDFRSLRWANYPEHIAGRFRNYCRLMDHRHNVLPVPIVDVDYEETVADLETVARRLIAECELKWEPACLDFYRTERPVRTASLTQVRQPIYQRLVARWKHYESSLRELMAAVSADDRSRRRAAVPVRPAQRPVDRTDFASFAMPAMPGHCGALGLRHSAMRGRQFRIRAPQGTQFITQNAFFKYFSAAIRLETYVKIAPVQFDKSIKRGNALDMSCSARAT